MDIASLIGKDRDREGTMLRYFMIAIAMLMALPAFAEPDEQTRFGLFVQKYRNKWEGTHNDLIKADLSAARTADLRKAALHDRLVFDRWEMFVLSVNLTKSGTVWLGLISNMSREPNYGIANMPTRDDGRVSLAITKTSPLYPVLRELEQGDVVFVSGEFYIGPDDMIFEYDSQTSNDADGGMRHPIFAAVFTAIEKAPIPGLQPTRPVR